MKIRTATIADVSQIIALEKSAITAAHWSDEQYQAAFSSVGPVRLALVVESEEEVCGFLVARAAGREWELENIAIADAAQRQGLGARLIFEFLESVRARNAEAVFLEARESNIGARTLYEKVGFTETGRRRNYYRGPAEDAVVYRIAFGKA